MSDVSALIEEAREEARNNDPHGHAERLRQLAEWARMDLHLPSVGERLDEIADALVAAEARTTDDARELQLQRDSAILNWRAFTHMQQRAERAETQLAAITRYVAEPITDWPCEQIRAYLRGQPSDLDLLDGVDRGQETTK